MTVDYIDYYKVLGVPRSASPKEIKSAFKKAALKYHPDLKAANEKAASEEQFKKINEAYEVLSDPEKKEKYDQLGDDLRDGQSWQQPPDMGRQQYQRQSSPQYQQWTDNQWTEADASSFSDFFESLFGGAGAKGFGAGTFTQQRRDTRGQDLDTEFALTLEEAYHGGKKTIEFSLRNLCDECAGVGAVKQKTCQGCGGTGYKTKRKKLTVNIPAGVKDGSKIRLKGQGTAGSGAGKPGDLWLIIKLLPHTTFTLTGDDIETKIKVKPPKAVLGGNISVPTIDGQVIAKVPPMFRSGQKLRLQAKGWRRKDGSRGDQFVEIGIDIPTTLTKEEKALYEKLAEIGG
jgi:curved DNA-binding protein